MTLAALSAHCRRNAAPLAGRVRLRFSGYTGNPAETSFLAALVDEFNAAQSRIHVTYEPITGQYVPKLLAMLVSGTAPDVFYLDSMYFRPFLAKRKILTSLEPFLRESKTRKSDFLPELVEAFTDAGTLYGIPKDFTSWGLFYDKDRFDEAGLSYPDDSWDFERVREIAIKLTKPNGPHGFILNHDKIDRWLPIARAFGAELFDPDGRCAIASAEGIRSLEFYANLKLRDGAAIHPGDVGAKYIEEAFGRRTGAMNLNGGWAISYLHESNPDVNYGIAPMPRGPAGRSNFLFTVAYAIPKGAKDPLAAWQLIEFLTSEASQARVDWALPSRRAASARYVEARPRYAPLLEGVRFGRAYEFGPKSNRVEARLSVAVQEVFLGAKSAAAALRDAAIEIDRLHTM